MALVTTDFNINITPGEMPPVVHVSEYDIGRSYTVGLIGENDDAFTIPSGTTATIEGTLNGVVGFSVPATISNNKVAFTLTESMTAYAGKAWCKIKLTQKSQPIQTCAFVLAVDRAGVEAETVIGAPGFEEQIVDAVNDWLDAHPPAAGGMTEDVKTALLNCFEHVAWIDDQGQDYYDALYAALYPPVDVLSISAVFTQGSATIYDTDSLDTLKQYLVVTATMTDSTTRTLEDADYTLSGTLAVGTSTITVSYGGKTTTFNVAVTHEELMLNDILTLDGIENTRNGHNASATTWEDLSGNDNDFAKIGTNAPIWNADNAQFDATDRTLGLTKNLFGTYTSVSVEIVLEITGNGSGVDSNVYIGGVFTNREYNTLNNGIDLYTYNTSGMSAYWKSNSLGYTGNLGNTIKHICYVFTGGNCLRYVNGVLASTNAAATFFDGTARRDEFRIGGNKMDNATWFCNAKIYRIGIDSTAFTAETVAERFAFFADRFGIAAES